MKKLIAGLLLLAFCFAFCACGLTNGTEGLDPDFKAALDSYEEFIDEYVAFMKKYNANPTDMNLLSSYASYMSKYSQFASDFAKWEDEELNAAEKAYYLQVQSRVSKKLLDIL
ncbi:MAG: hypothetical protein IJO72_06505 [Oscillospiraceae bacterium]|nr:hypothetical protein [Oscillospiraceae bacterium]